MESITYYKYVRQNKKQLGLTSLIPPAFFTLEGIQSTIAWLISGPIILILILSYFTISNGPLILLAYLAVLVYAPLQFVVVYMKAESLLDISYIKRSGYLEGVIIGFLSIPAVIFHSLPPYVSLFNKLRVSWFNYQLHKPKTDE